MSLKCSPAKRIGELLKEQLRKDPHFYFFSPDETTSNRFDAVFEADARAWCLPTRQWDLPENQNGRIIELLSENVLFSVMTGHLMNGENAMMGSYEAFFPVITSQLLQQVKFIKQTKQTNWRDDLPAVNLLSTSTCWRQDHNGYTHQSPALISTLLSVPSNLCNCLFPVDDIAAEAAFNFMLESKNVVNLTTFNKIEEPRYLSHDQAASQLKNSGVIVMDAYSDDNPDIVLVGVGDIMMKEMINALEILREDLPGVKFRLINVSALSYRAIGTTENKLSKESFDEIFTENCPIVAAFHGYPETFENILENYAYRGRLRVHGFNEEGSTTTPFEMLRRNGASRYDIAIDIVSALEKPELAKKYQNILDENHKNAVNFGEDLLK